MPIPEPRPGESEREFVARCIPTQVEEGKTQDVAAGICFSTFQEAKATNISEAAKLLDTRLQESIHRPEDRRRRKKKKRKR